MNLLLPDKTKAALEAIVAVQSSDRSGETTDADEPTDAQLTQWWLDYGVDRKLLNRNSATFRLLQGYSRWSCSKPSTF